MMRPTLLLLCLLSSLQCLPAWASPQDARQLSEIASYSRLVCASAMAYFNPREREPNQDQLSAMFYQMNTLERLVQQQGRPDPLQRPLTAMKSLFLSLDGLPRERADEYPALVRQLLEQARTLQRSAGEAAASAGADPRSESFGAQSQALAVLLLDYELRGYPLPDRQAFALSDTELQALDDSVGQRFAELEAGYPQYAGEVGKLSGTYRFVRAQLRGQKAYGRGGAEFYLGRAVTDLNELAEKVAN
ncbi:hypothetical protein D3C76_1052250 [compost metagenome]|uniref:Uncharacterized protein n=2 Tax=Pseudomonas jinjuensis TaxID=198616 RepID=A0A1H0LMJ7_9PSED|nr:hypothetical protein SAMN05216193_114123 [Pseudomonas jinjuensis]